MNIERIIRLGLPKGSLNTPGRGNTYEVLLNAGYDIRGYEPGKESDQDLRIENDPEIIPRLSRPQSAALELARGFSDIALAGEDLIRETTVIGANNNIRRIGSLEYGGITVVFAVSNESNYVSLSDVIETSINRQILCCSEYIGLTRQAFMRNATYRAIYGDKSPLVQMRGFTNGENEQVQILYSDGATEGYIAKGADIITDNSQTGNSLRRYNLRVLEPIMQSTVGLYTGPSCVGWKEAKAQEIFERLKGGEKYESRK